MEKEAPSSVRLFVALELPEATRRALVAWQGEVFGGHGRSVRVVRAESLHVTLAFLGHHPPDAVGEIEAAALAGLGAVRAPEFEPEDVRGLPRGRPRLWAVGLSDANGRAAAVHEAVAAPLAAGGWYRREKRPFWPHVTAARARASERPPRLSPEPPPLGSFRASEVVLYRSRLSRAGADYEPLARLTLR